MEPTKGDPRVNENNGEANNLKQNEGINDIEMEGRVQETIG